MLNGSGKHTTRQTKRDEAKRNAKLKKKEKNKELQERKLNSRKSQKDLKTTTPAELQPIETDEEVKLIADTSLLSIKESLKPAPDQELEAQFNEKVRIICEGFDQAAEATDLLLECEIKIHENSYHEKEKKLIAENTAKLKDLQSEMIDRFAKYKKIKDAEHRNTIKQIVQKHTQQVKAYEENFVREKAAYETECKTFAQGLRVQHKKELESLENEKKLFQENMINNINAYKEQLGKEIENYMRDITLRKEELVEQHKEKMKNEEETFQQAKRSLRQLLESQNNQEITLIKKTYEQEITLIKEKHEQEFLELKQELIKEQPSILEKTKINIQENHDNNCAQLLNTHQEEIAALKKEFTSQIDQEKEKLEKINNEEIEKNKLKFKQTKRDLKDQLKNQNQQDITLIKQTHEKELQKLQDEQSSILEKIKLHSEQSHYNYRTKLLNTQHEKISELKRGFEQACKPYKSIIGLTPRATISYFPGEVRVILHLLEKHNIENYIFGGYIRDALWAESLLDSDDIDIRVNCDPQDLPPDILACVNSFVQIDTLKVGRVERVNLVCGPLENLKAELLNKDFKINTLICRNGRVYDLLGVYDHLSHSYLETMTPTLDSFNKNPDIMLRLIRLSIKLNKDILSTDYLAIHEKAYLIFSLSHGKYFSNLQKLFINYAAPEYYRRVKDLGLLHIVIPILFHNYKNYDGFVILERFWLKKIEEFAHCPRHYDGNDVFALFLLMPFLLKLNELTIRYVNPDPINAMNVERRQYVKSSFQPVMKAVLKRFVGFSIDDKNLIRCCILPLIMGDNKVPGLYQQYHQFKALEFKNQQLVNQESYSDILTPFRSYTPSYYQSVQSGYFLNRGNDNFSPSSPNTTPQDGILKRNPF